MKRGVKWVRPLTGKEGRSSENSLKLSTEKSKIDGWKENTRKTTRKY